MSASESERSEKGIPFVVNRVLSRESMAGKIKVGGKKIGPITFGGRSKIIVITQLTLGEPMTIYVPPMPPTKVQTPQYE